jgi:CheY-like chemotaxis protein
MKSIFAPFCGVVEARDGQEALDMCRKTPPDLIITDVMMPIASHELSPQSRQADVARWMALAY